jgi:hypothetical protein
VAKNNANISNLGIKLKVLKVSHEKPNINSQ